MAFLQVPEDVGFSVLPPGDMHVYTSVVPGSDGATDCEGTAGAVTAGLLGAAVETVGLGVALLVGIASGVSEGD